MDSSVSTGVVALIGQMTPVAIATYLAIFGAVLAIAMPVFGLKLGWGKAWRALRGGH